MMAWEKATYWMAVGLLAVTAGNSFVNRHQDWVDDLTNHSLEVAQEVSGRAMVYMNLAEMTAGRGETRFARVQPKVACLQTQLASMEVAMAHEQAGLAKVAAERAQLAALEQLSPRLVCPRSNITIAIPRAHPMPHQGTI
jgi:hypothetical protein